MFYCYFAFCQRTMKAMRSFLFRLPGKFLAMALPFSMHAQVAAGPVATAQARLLAQRTSVQSLGAVPPQVQQGIALFQDALVEATDAALASLAPAATQDEADAALRRVLPEESVGTAEFQFAAALAAKHAPQQVDVAGLYGSGLRIRASRARPDLILIQEGFVLPCGDDTVLLAYRKDASGWRRVLRWQSGRYATMSGAYGDGFDALALPMDSGGQALLVVKHGTPACTSTESSLSLTVLDIGSAASPKVVWSLLQPYRRFDLDRLSKLAITPEGFSVHASYPDLDPELTSKEATLVYRVTPQGVMRATPLAQRSVDIVDEWFRMPWAEAKSYIDSPDRRDLEGIHWRIHKDHGSGQHVGPVRYISQRSCNDSPTRQQVELDLRPQDTNMEETAIVLVEPAADHPIRFASATLDPACDGPNELHTVTKHAVNVP